jgi:hypothetical protein
MFGRPAKFLLTSVILWNWVNFVPWPRWNFYSCSSRNVKIIYFFNTLNYTLNLDEVHNWFLLRILWGKKIKFIKYIIAGNEIYKFVLLYSWVIMTLVCFQIAISSQNLIYRSKISSPRVEVAIHKHVNDFDPWLLTRFCC